MQETRRCYYCGEILYRFDAYRKDDKGYIHVSCQRRKEREDMLKQE